MELTKADRRRIVEVMGIPIEDYISQARHGCSICGDPQSSLLFNLDRDPITNKPKGLLCSICRKALSLRDPDWYTKAASYLSKSISRVVPIAVDSDTTDTDACPFGPDFKFDPTNMSSQEIKRYMDWANARDFG